MGQGKAVDGGVSGTGEVTLGGVGVGRMGRVGEGRVGGAGEACGLLHQEEESGGGSMYYNNKNLPRVVQSCMHSTHDQCLHSLAC